CYCAPEDSPACGPLMAGRPADRPGDHHRQDSWLDERMGFWVYVGKRLALLVPVLIGMTIVVFGMLRLIPGDPAFLYLGERATPEAAAVVREQLGLNRPLTEQYWRFVSGIFTGSLGNSLYYKKPVLGLILER